MPETLKGIIERVTFHNPDNGFAVLQVQVTGRQALVTMVGHCPSVVAGEHVEAEGEWVQDRDHGLQFQASRLTTASPQTRQGIERYLGSGVVRGIGPHFARKIVEVFGERTLTVIDESPTFLREVKGIGARRIQRIRESWSEQKAVRAIVLFLQSHGVGTARAMRIHKCYGERAIELVRANPYRLASDIWGIGFQTADQLAQRLGVDPESPFRAAAAIHYVLQKLGGQGHSAFPEAALIERTSDVTDIRPEILAKAVLQGRSDGSLVRDSEGTEPWLYTKALYLAEVNAARALASFQRQPHPLLGIERAATLAWVESEMGLELAPAQRAAIVQATVCKVLIVTGGPGVGKTTIVRGILEIFGAKGLRSMLCAPTGRAAKRLAEATGREAKTIHRLLEFAPAGGGFKRDHVDPLDVDLVVVDEASMLDIALFHQLLRALPSNACLVLVGDVDQLPSVGPGNVLADIIGSGALPVIRLTQIFRQASQSRIVRAAHQVNHGEIPDQVTDPQSDFFIIHANAPERIIERILQLVRERIPARFGYDPVRDLQVLTPMNRFELGARNLNLRLQGALNPQPSGAEVQRYGWTYRVGDKVLQTINNYKKEVFNGDLGLISAIDAIDQQITVDFDGRSVHFDFGELDELALGYALTIHKSQGSEYPAVVIPLHSQHFMLLQRNLLYTAITRGKKLVVVVGSHRAVRLAVERHEPSARFSALRRRLVKAMESAEE